MRKRWQLLEADESKVEALQKALGINSTVCKILVQRGIETYDQAKHFFRPSLDDLHDPFLMKDMDKAVERIEMAIRQEENILIFGDYDVDGTTAVSVTYSFFKNFYPNLDYYVPDRYAEGYGVSLRGIDYAEKQKCSLIIALDCGITAIDQVIYAKSKGIDFIICDHHNPGDELPQAVALLDPKRKDCPYPYKELSGCGIGYKLIQAYAQRNSIPTELVEEQLDLVAVSIASDIVPITGENRVLEFYGLKQLNQNPRPGLKALIDVTGYRERFTVGDVVFKIGPRINASGRMGHARSAVELLTTEDASIRAERTQTINKLNNERKETDADITNEALRMISENPAFQNRKTTVLYNQNWHKGVIGIVASRVMESYYRPTIVCTESKGVITGSARSVSGFNLYDALKACQSELIQFGGHKYAAGLSVEPDNFENFARCFEEVVSDRIDPELLIPTIKLNATLSIEHINMKLFNILDQMAPFGPGNMRPQFLIEEVFDAGGTRIVGQSHLKLSLKNEASKSVSGIAFGMSDKADLVWNTKRENGETGDTLDVVSVVDKNVWNGTTTLQLRVKDIRSHQEDSI